MSPRTDLAPIVRVEGLHKRFGTLEVLKGIDMDVHVRGGRGDLRAVGFGQEHPARCVNFLEDPTSGVVEVDGLRLSGGHRTRPSASRSAACG